MSRLIVAVEDLLYHHMNCNDRITKSDWQKHLKRAGVKSLGVLAIKKWKEKILKAMEGTVAEEALR